MINKAFGKFKESLTPEDRARFTTTVKKDYDLRVSLESKFFDVPKEKQLTFFVNKRRTLCHVVFSNDSELFIRIILKRDTYKNLSDDALHKALIKRIRFFL